jgi:hypothetical protein
MATTYKARHAARKVRGKAWMVAGKASAEREHVISDRIKDRANHGDGELEVAAEMAADGARD